MRHLTDNRFSLSIPLLEVGCFEAKAFFLPDGSSEPEWPEGKNSHIKVEPADYCCNNTIYAAFVRQFGAALNSKDPAAGHAQSIRELDALGYSVIPRSGTFRDLIKELDFIMGTLRFRIIQLLPIHPTPTTYARMGRFGSPFAAMDFEEVDPALAEFDRRTTPLDQFRELVDAVHQRDGRLFIDIPSNHTGWAAHLQMRHPEWFVHNGDRTFQSPGAWGVTWEDLSQLDYKNLALWKYMAEVLLLWRRRGVDGFRCDAGYMIPYPAWEYIVAKVRNEFPDTVFLLEGLGGKAEVVESLLAGADLNWAYSELFQNYDRAQIESYLPGAMHVSSTRGTLVHFAETHDNLRLAARSHSHARMRTALCALASHNGSFGITNGVEWFADEKIDVHEASHLNWGSADNQIDHVARLNAILEVSPAFQPDSTVRMIQHGPGNVLVLLRESSAPVARVLVVANLNDDKPDTASWKESDWHAATEGMHDLVSGRKVTVERTHEILRCSLAPGEVLCLSTEPACLSAVEQALQHAPSASGRQVTQRFRAKALEVYSVQHGSRDCSNIDLEGAVRELARNPRLFCHSAARNPKTAAADSAGALSHGGLPPVTTWVWPRDARRTVMVPPGHFLNIRCKHRFTAELSNRDTIVRRETSLPQEDGSHFALFVPVAEPERQSEYSLLMIVHEPEVCSRTTAPVIFLTRLTRALVRTAVGPTELRRDDCYALCTNGRGAMAQVRGAWGEIRTQYDALLAGNLHHAYPVDRHVMLTRCRGWIANKGYSLPINIDCLEKFSASPDGVLEWLFAAPVGQGKIINLQMRFWMNHGRNAVTIEISRKHARADSDDLDDIVPVKLILRPDIEDRSNHCKTKAYAGPEAAWQRAVTTEATGFLFSPSEDRRLRMSCAPGTFTREPEWSYM
ncbi:MAG: glycogen debranching enzyme N-terminal domain-containing protein, partial [bacterium]